MKLIKAVGLKVYILHFYVGFDLEFVKHPSSLLTIC